MRWAFSVVLSWSLVLALSFGLVAAQDPIRVAAVLALTGIAADHNAPLIPMLELAVEEVNHNGGLLGRTVQLFMLDNESTAIGSKKAAEGAIHLGVTAVVGAAWSSHSLAIAPILQKAGIPMISPGSTNPAVTQVGDYIFRACFLDSFQGRAMARFVYRDLGVRKAAVMKNIDEVYSLALGEFFMSAFRQDGGKVVLDADYRGKAVDFAEILTQVKQLNPEVLYIPGYTRDSGLLIRQARALGIQAVFLGGDAWDEIQQIAGDALDGSFQSSHWHPQVPFPGSAHLQDLYRRKYGTAITSFNAPTAYDAFMLLAEAIRKAGTVERSKIRDALANIRGFQGATGDISFDESRDPQNKEVVILKWQKGVPIFIQTIKSGP